MTVIKIDTLEVLMKRLLLPVVALSILTLAGCANTSGYSGDVYRGSQAKTGQSVTYGTIVAVRPVQIQAESRAGGLLGSGGGAVIGGLLGSQVVGGGPSTLDPDNLITKLLGTSSGCGRYGR